MLVPLLEHGAAGEESSMELVTLEATLEALAVFLPSAVTRSACIDLGASYHVVQLLRKHGSYQRIAAAGCKVLWNMLVDEGCAQSLLDQGLVEVTPGWALGTIPMSTVSPPDVPLTSLLW